MADLTLTADAQELVLTIGAESHRLPLADVERLHERIDYAVREARDNVARAMRQKQREDDIARAKAEHPDGWAILIDDRPGWAWCDIGTAPARAPYVGGWSHQPAIIATAPASYRWRNYGARVVHIGGGETGYRCGGHVHDPTREPDDTARTLCPKCAAGVTP